MEKLCSASQVAILRGLFGITEKYLIILKINKYLKHLLGSIVGYTIFKRTRKYELSMLMIVNIY